MQRLHEHISPELRSDCDELLRHSMKITQAMIEIACMREWFFTAQSMIEFRRSLVQAMDIKTSQLLQIPHFDEEILKHCHRGKQSVSTLTDFIHKDPEQRKGLAKMEPHQLADIEAFCAHVSDPELTANIEVEDEGEICVGDVATLTVSLLRKNLGEGESMGPVHAPFFPEPKFEEWYLFLVEAVPTTRIVAFEKVKDTDRLVQEKLRFQVTRPGKHTLTLYALCDSYHGLDQKVELNFTAMQEEEVKRAVFLHPEDEDLDLVPTLFQQMMGDFGKEESEDEEGGEAKKDKSKETRKLKSKAKGSGKEAAEGEEEDDEAEESSEEKPAEKKKDGKKKKGNDSDSDSSSDSE